MVPLVQAYSADLEEKHEALDRINTCLRATYVLALITFALGIVSCCGSFYLIREEKKADDDNNYKRAHEAELAEANLVQDQRP